MSGLPAVAILAEPGSPPGFVALVAAIGAWCRPSASAPAPVGWLASSPAAAGENRPVAVWVGDRAAWAAAGGAVTLTVTADPELAAMPGGPVLFPHPGLDLRAYVPLAPVVRSRWRSRLGLPATLVVTADAVPDDLRPTSMALASVVVATGERLAEALAWAAPCVTDERSAAAVGATDNDVVIGPAAALDRLAAEVADDDPRGAALSAAGRRLAERTLDQHAPARRVATALGLVTATPAQRVLDDLRTPAASPLRSRIDALLSA